MAYNINIVNRVGRKNNSINRSTVANKKSDISDAKNSFNSSSKSSGAAIVGEGLNASRGVIGMTTGMSATKMVGLASASLALMVEQSSKIHDVVLSVRGSTNGNDIYHSNVKATKGIVMSLGSSLVKQMFTNELITKNQVRRQNYELEYGRELYLLNNYGEKYKVR